MGRPIRGSSGSPTHVAYYIALAGVVLLLVLLCCYLVYFCIRKIAEFSESDVTQPMTSSSQSRQTYPIQPVVRESATSMVKICKQLPSSNKDIVFPTSTSPETQQLANVGAPLSVPRIVPRPTLVRAAQDIQGLEGKVSDLGGHIKAAAR